ncbi:MAG: polymer-forming cytoskeletal protein [Proteobacteria bacterium]|nr:polymer-forming cytoskeletal protein [Pseudomonadota bacterium]
MIFGKSKPTADDESLRKETYQRWREASESAVGEVEKVGEVKSGKAPDWPNQKATPITSQDIDLTENIEPLYKSKPQTQNKQSSLNSLNTEKQPKSINNVTSLNANFNILGNKISPEDEVRRRFGTNIRSALGEGTIIEGTFTFDTPVCIEGTLIGEIRSSSLLIVGSQATVQAKIKVGSLVVLGNVKGDVTADELVEIKQEGMLEGNVSSERFAMDEGAWFQGRITPTAPKIVVPKVEEEVKQEDTAKHEPQQLSLSDMEITQELNRNELADSLLLQEDEIESIAPKDKWSF